MTAAATSLLDHLMNAGYDPPEEPGSDGGDWYDLTASGTGTVRVCIYPDDGYSTRIYAFDKTMGNTWEARFSPGTPDPVIVAAIEAAERELARKRGGPVTPAQVAARPVTHAGMLAHDGYAPHSHEVRPDHLGVQQVTAR